MGIDTLRLEAFRSCDTHPISSSCTLFPYPKTRKNQTIHFLYRVMNVWNYPRGIFCIVSSSTFTATFFFMLKRPAIPQYLQGAYVSGVKYTQQAGCRKRQEPAALLS
jgi:hypothetical protein